MNELEHGWKAECQQLRHNNRLNHFAMQAFVQLAEQEAEAMSPKLCLALHHLAMRLGNVAGRNVLRRGVSGAQLGDVPQPIYEYKNSG